MRQYSTMELLGLRRSLFSEWKARGHSHILCFWQVLWRKEGELWGQRDLCSKFNPYSHKLCNLPTHYPPSFYYKSDTTSSDSPEKKFKWPINQKTPIQCVTNMSTRKCWFPMTSEKCLKILFISVFTPPTFPYKTRANKT